MRPKPVNTFGASALPWGACLFLSACGGSGDPAMDGSGYAYIATVAPQSPQTAGTVYQYEVGSDGSLTALSAASITVGPNPRAIASDPSGHYVYVVNGDNTISQYAVGGGGGLVALSPAIVNITIPASNSPDYSATVDPQGRFLYIVVSPYDLTAPPEAYIAAYAIGTGGQLTPLAPAYITAPIHAAGPLAIDSSGKHAYLAGGMAGPTQPGGEVAEFSVADAGTLTAVAPVTITTPAFYSTIALSGQTAYLLSPCVDTTCDGQIAEYTVQSDGSLAPTGATTLTGSHVIPISLVTDASGSTAYLLTNLMGIDTNTGAVYQYAISSTGGLAPDSPASLGVASGSVAQGTLGSKLQVLSSNHVGAAIGPPGGHVDHYAIGADGRLTFVSTTSVAAAGYPTAMTLVAAH
jgi:6-phosphogluconolactonase (cycloisomerase 2 family)